MFLFDENILLFLEQMRVMKKGKIDSQFFERKKKVLTYEAKYMKPFIEAFYPQFTNFRKVYNFKHQSSYNYEVLEMLEDVIERINIAKRLNNIEIRKEVEELLNSKSV